jgi:hypothetical protein
MEFLVLASLKSYAIVGALALVVGGALGYLFGGKVETAAQADIAKAEGAVSAAAQSAAKKL